MEVVQYAEIKGLLKHVSYQSFITRGCARENGRYQTIMEMFKAGKYDVYLSTVTLKEIEKCSESKKTQLIDGLNEISFTTLDITEDVTGMAKKIFVMGILTQKSFDDCQHIGAAVICKCDCIILWNFKHIVNVKTIRGVRPITI